MMLAFSARAGGLARRIGPRLPMTLGPLIMAAGLALMVRIEDGRTYVEAVLPALLVFSGGLALTVAPLTATALAAADARHAGIASGVNNAVARTGQLLAVALIPILAGFEAGEAVPADTLLDGFHRVALYAAAGHGARRDPVLGLHPVRRPRGPTERVRARSGPADEGPGRPTYHCGADAPPLAPDERPAPIT